jgi:hypothetical protein
LPDFIGYYGKTLTINSGKAKVEINKILVVDLFAISSFLRIKIALSKLYLLKIILRGFIITD